MITQRINGVGRNMEGRGGRWGSKEAVVQGIPKWGYLIREGNICIGLITRRFTWIFGRCNEGVGTEHHEASADLYTPPQHGTRPLQAAAARYETEMYFILATSRSEFPWSASFDLHNGIRVLSFKLVETRAKPLHNAYIEICMCSRMMCVFHILYINTFSPIRIKCHNNTVHKMI